MSVFGLPGAELPLAVFLQGPKRGRTDAADRRKRRNGF